MSSLPERWKRTSQIGSSTGIGTPPPGWATRLNMNRFSSNVPRVDSWKTCTYFSSESTLIGPSAAARIEPPTSATVTMPTPAERSSCGNDSLVKPVHSWLSAAVVETARSSTS